MSDYYLEPWYDWGNTYFNLNGRPIAKYIGGPGSEWDMEAFFFHANATGSTSMISWYNGDVVQKELFYPYGQRWTYGGGIGSFRFASLREYFPVSDPAEMFMSQTRDYPSRFYRWMSPDKFTGGPVSAYGPPDPTPPDALPYADITNPQSLNKYQYAYNNPLRYIDPSGRDALWVTNKDTGKTTLLIPVKFTGAAATSEVVSRIVNRANSVNTGDSGVEIKVVPTNTPIRGVLNQMDFSPGFDFTKYQDYGEGTIKMGGNEAHINSELGDAEGAVVHDTFHFAGVIDRYVELDPDEQGNRRSKAQEGYDSTNIMVDRGGTNLKPGQLLEAQQNTTTKQCVTEKGKTTCP